ncbi:hypothetical protein CDL15_Pgr011513 [Punica granatum]|uniref:Leucine-rich repeat-containing N-terminal plant-type domain-containing protein n=1 Tax=Punica granatum TaxID=22663 RepID=A0A218VV13_PUNGR|nr:hypothetical protein CDL15_Pgr011513 [Punica granatum]
MCSIIVALCLSFLLTPSSVALAASPPTLPSRLSSHADECTALLQFKNSLKINKEIVTRALCAESGFNYTSSLKTASWKQGTDCCTWEGITCDNITGNIIQVDLTCSYLEGTLHSNSSLFSLHHVQELYLRGNHLTGTIPSSICRKRSLRVLNLLDNYLSGTILPCLGNLSNLVSLDLGWNQLEGSLPRNLANCTNLNDLSVYGNDINDTFPFWLKSLPLFQLQLATNNFHGLITSGHAAFPFPYLDTLSIGLNYFHGQLPPEYFRLSNLILIDLSGNMFDGFLPIPPVTAEVYAAGDNKFTGEIPPSFCNITTLSLIDQSINSLTGKIPQCLINVNTNLAILALAGNRLQGPLPEILAPKNCSLNTVDLSRNHLQGKLPRSWASCKPLEVLDLCDNELEDSFPSWLETLPNLYILTLRANKFHGPITSPKFIHPFPVLHILDISNNNFIGTFPSQYIANFNYMMGGDKGQGLLKYATEAWFESQSTTVIYKGVEMRLSYIREALVLIDLSHNHFHGEIPKVIGNLQSLTGLNLSHNNFRGLIPTSLGNLKHLEWLDLSSNNFTGQIPATLTNLTFLAIFNVSTNQLTGQIPQGKQFGTFSSDSFEGNPNLCGPPLPKPCTESHQQEVPSASQDEDDAERWIEWRAVLMGYGCGTEPSSPVNLTRQRMVDVSGLCIKCEEQNNTAVRLFMFKPEGHAC